MLRNKWLQSIAPSAIVAIIGFVLAYQFVDPAPPRTMTLGTGSEQGAYSLFGEQYRKILAREQIDLGLIQTAGSIQNIEKLLTTDNPLDAAFVQSGSAKGISSDKLLSLGSLYFEPVWIFYRGTETIHRITELEGKRIAIGNHGSGTQALAIQLLNDNLLTSTQTKQLTMEEAVAVEKLLSGDIDALFIVASAQSPTVKRLLSTAEINLMSFDRADAYTRIHRSLSSVTLPEGAIDLKLNIPAQDTVLLAAAANLVVREDLHPALIDLLLQAAQEVHGNGGWFERNGQFPSSEYLEFTISPDARRFYQYGPPLLQRFLPFWAASFIDRMKVLLLPMIALLLPLMKIMPPLYRWRMRSRVYRWYRELQDIDLGLFHQETVSINQYRQDLDRIEHEVANVDIPLSYADELFNLRLHIELIRRRLADQDKLMLKKKTG